MIHRQIDLAILEAKKLEAQHENRQADNYEEMTKRRKRTFPKTLRGGTLEALKKLLAQSKAQTDSAGAMSIANPFTKPFVSPSKKEGLGKIEASTALADLQAKLIDKLTHIEKNGIRETSFTIGDNSIFKGTKITITEYSTAPRSFNILFASDQNALTFFAAHFQELQNGLKNFIINRIDTSLLTEDEKHAIKPIESDPEEDNE